MDTTVALQSAFSTEPLVGTERPTLHSHCVHPLVTVILFPYFLDTSCLLLPTPSQQSTSNNPPNSQKNRSHQMKFASTSGLESYKNSQIYSKMLPFLPSDKILPFYHFYDFLRNLTCLIIVSLSHHLSNIYTPVFICICIHFYMYACIYSPSRLITIPVTILTSFWQQNFTELSRSTFHSPLSFLCPPFY